MASEWQKYTIQDLIHRQKLVVGDGYRAKNEELSGEGLPFARAGNINNGFHFSDADHFPVQNLAKVGNKVSCAGDVVFTSKGTVGRFAFVRQESQQFVYSPQLCFWRSLDSDFIDPRYLYFWMFGREFYVQFKGVAGQTDMAEYVSLTDQRRMHITLPPFEEQRAIAHILRTLDDKIELNRKRNETLEAMARALFQSWFVDFEPVRAKAEGRPTGLPAHIAALFPDSFEPSELGPIPKGWSVAKIADLASLSKASIAPGKYPDEEFAHFSLPAYDEGKKPRIEAGSTIKSNKFIVPNSAVLLSKLNPSIPRVWLPDLDTLQRPICSTEFLVLAPAKSFFREYLFSLVTNVQFRTQFLSLVGGTSNSHQRVKPDGLLDMQAILPPENLIAEYARCVRPLLNRVQSNGKESESLAALRDTLLPKLISGEIRLDSFLERGGARL